MEQNSNEQQEKPKRPSPVSALIPTKDYFITPILININIIVFLLMVVIGGASFTAPSPEVVMKWGANARAETMGGEWWRLVTAMFLHYGIIHITVNMLSLHNIGRILEPFIGRVRFLVLYLASGIAASVASIWWHDIARAAGASGAIMGIVGVLGALATTNMIRREIRNSLLRSIGFALLLTAGMGFSGFVDNAGHFGGLVAGAIGGYLIYFELKAWYVYKKRQYTFLALSVLLIGGICTGFWMMTPPAIDVDGQYARLQKENHAAEVFYSSLQKDQNPSAEKIRSELVIRWENCDAILDSMMAIKDLPKSAQEEFATRKSYTQQRINGAQYLFRWSDERDSTMLDSAQLFMAKADSIVIILNAQIKKNE